MNTVNRVVQQTVLAAALAYLSYLALDAFSPLHSVRSSKSPILQLWIIVGPILALYFFLKIFLHTFIALSTIAIVEFLLLSINFRKMAETGEPLSWGDLLSPENWSLAIHYSEWWHYLVLIVAAILVVVYWFVRKNPCKRQNASVSQTLRRSALLMTLSFAASASVAPQYIHRLTPMLGAPILDIYRGRVSPYYTNWNWPLNASRNGLYTHLIQTSVRSIPPAATQSEKALFSDIAPSRDSGKGRPTHIIYILCEACWHDAVHFADVFEPLKLQGMVQYRGISPTYGGGTANSEFEMYTSLPSKAVLHGIIFQEYARQFSLNSETMVSGLKDEGYSTFAMHNFFRKFWQRDVVLEKLGFDQYDGIEDMPHSSEDRPYFPYDQVLYDHALGKIRQFKNEPFFASLITVSTHGGYKEVNGDEGITNYVTRMTRAIEEMAEFVAKANEINPNTLIVVYGDHKPSLTSFFKKNGVLTPKDMDQNVIGDIPVYISFPLGMQGIDTLRPHIDKKPLYCIAAALDTLLIKSGSRSSKYVYDNACREYSDYRSNYQKIPSWLYRLALFS